MAVRFVRGGLQSYSAPADVFHPTTASTLGNVGTSGTPNRGRSSRGGGGSSSNQQAQQQNIQAQVQSNQQAQQQNIQAQKQQQINTALALQSQNQARQNLLDRQTIIKTKEENFNYKNIPIIAPREEVTKKVSAGDGAEITYQISKGEGVKRVIKQLGENIVLTSERVVGIGKGSKMELKDIWGGLNNPLVGFEYATPPAGKTTIINPDYQAQYGSMTIMSPSLAPIESKQFITKQELYENPKISFEIVNGENYIVSTPRISTAELMGRKFSAKETTQALKTGAIIGASILSPEVGFIVGSIGAYQGLGMASNKDLTTKERIISGVGGVLSLAGAGAFTSATFSRTSAELRQLTAENLLNQNKKIPFKGVRLINDETAMDIFGKQIKTDLGSLESKGQVLSKMTGGNTYLSKGEVISDVRIKDYWSGKTFGTTTKDVISSTGKLLPTQKGITPSFGELSTFNIAELNTISSAKINTLKLNILAKGIRVTKEGTAGRTAQVKDLIFSQAGSRPRININYRYRGPFDTGESIFTRTTSLGFTKDTEAILKIIKIPSAEEGGAITISRGTKTITGGRGSQIPVSISQPQFNSITKSMTYSPSNIFSKGVLTSNISPSQIYKIGSKNKLDFKSLTSTTQSISTIPALTTKQIPETKTRSSTQVIQIPARSTQVIQIPAISTITEPITRTRMEQPSRMGYPHFKTRMPKIKISTIPPEIPTLRLPRLRYYGGTNRRGSYSVFLRRFGKFNLVGKTSDINQAFNIGTSKARNTLGRTFKVTGSGGIFKTPVGFYQKKSKKDGMVFVQKALKGSLGTLGSYGEKLEIQGYSKSKKKKLKGGYKI